MFIGWDVGGWNCDSNTLSRDALVIVDADGNLVGRPWRGNLRNTILNCATASNFVYALFGLCHADDRFDAASRSVLAIDAPLALPRALLALARGQVCEDMLTVSSQNPYLYRFTERRLAAEGLTPLSTVKDMIGSQSAKAMHAVAKFLPHLESVGVWTGPDITAIETYPSLCRRRLREGFLPPCEILECKPDIVDACVCAMIARTYALARTDLEGPVAESPPDEGWIWAPCPPAERNPA